VAVAEIAVDAAAPDDVIEVVSVGEYVSPEHAEVGLDEVQPRALRAVLAEAANAFFSGRRPDRGTYSTLADPSFLFFRTARVLAAACLEVNQESRVRFSHVEEHDNASCQCASFRSSRIGSCATESDATGMGTCSPVVKDTWSKPCSVALRAGFGEKYPSKSTSAPAGRAFVWLSARGTDAQG
jgi:hypothetical protein